LLYFTYIIPSFLCFNLDRKPECGELRGQVSLYGTVSLRKLDQGSESARHSRLIYAQHDAFHTLGSFFSGKTRLIREYAISHIFFKSSIMTRRAWFYFLHSPPYFRMNHATQLHRLSANVACMAVSVSGVRGWHLERPLGAVDISAQVLADVS
jgi:hypothetical protein